MAGAHRAALLQSREAIEIGVAGAVRINGTSDRLLSWLKDIAACRKAEELGIAHTLRSPPQIGDFGDLSLSDDELKAVEACRPGRCDLRLGAGFSRACRWPRRMLDIEIARWKLKIGRGTTCAASP
jgi:hypothetical protein